MDRASNTIVSGTTNVLAEVLVQMLIAIVRIYQVVVSPSLGSVCRFHPSCSEYAIEAIREHGGLNGTWLAMRRLGRCRPMGPDGFDPVPQRVIRGS